MEIPESIKERYGSTGESIFKTAHKAGKLDGAKVAKDEFATEMNTLVNSVINAKNKEGYVPPSIDDVAKVVDQVFARGKPSPDRNGLKRLATTLLKGMQSMPKPEPVKKTETKPANP